MPMDPVGSIPPPASLAEYERIHPGITQEMLRWNEAQAAYFEAQRLETDSPDYAFNLAISLERIQQPHLALEYYQRALKLAQTKAAAFDVAVAKARIQQLIVTK